MHFWLVVLLILRLCLVLLLSRDHLVSVNGLLRSQQFAELLFSTVIVEEAFISLSESLLLIVIAFSSLVLTAIRALVLILLLLFDLVNLVYSRIHEVLVNVLNSNSTFRPFQRPVSSPRIVVAALAYLIVTFRPILFQNSVSLPIVIMVLDSNLTHYWLISQFQTLDSVLKLSLLLLRRCTLGLVDAFEHVQRLVAPRVLRLQFPEFGELRRQTLLSAIVLLSVLFATLLGFRPLHDGSRGRHILLRSIWMRHGRSPCWLLRLGNWHRVLVYLLGAVREISDDARTVHLLLSVIRVLVRQGSGADALVTLLDLQEHAGAAV